MSWWIRRLFSGVGERSVRINYNFLLFRLGPQLLRHYGIWLLTCPRSFKDPRILREDKNGYDLPTQFQRVVGVRYEGRKAPRFPNSKGGYLDNRRSGPQKRVSLLLKGFFTIGPVPRSKLLIAPRRRPELRRRSGFVALWAPNIRFVSVGGIAHFIGRVLVKKTAD